MTYYRLTYKPTNGRPENYTDFTSKLARDLFILSMGDKIAVVNTSEVDQSETQHLGDEIDRMVAELPAVRARIEQERAR